MFYLLKMIKNNTSLLILLCVAVLRLQLWNLQSFSSMSLLILLCVATPTLKPPQSFSSMMSLLIIFLLWITFFYFAFLVCSRTTVARAQQLLKTNQDYQNLKKKYLKQLQNGEYKNYCVLQKWLLKKIQASLVIITMKKISEVASADMINVNLADLYVHPT